MKKKWQLIKEAYDRYPKGINCVSPSTGHRFTACGNYQMNTDGSIHCVESLCMIYSVRTGGKWATIVEPEQKPDLLDGKVAIRVNDEHEFKALMKHYEDKGWQTAYKYNYDEVHNCYDYHDNFRRSNQQTQEMQGYRIVDFPDFAAHVGIEVRKPVLRSEDDVDLYEGDGYCLAIKTILGWQYSKRVMGDKAPNFNSHVFAFSTPEAAEAWVADKNRAKSIKLYQTEYIPVEVFNDKITLDCSKPHISNQLIITAQELEEIYAAYQKVKGGEHGA